MLKTLFEVPIFKEDEDSIIYGIQVCYSHYIATHYPDSMIKDLYEKSKIPVELHDFIKLAEDSSPRGKVYTATIEVNK